MGSFISRGHEVLVQVVKQMKTDGNGNVERSSSASAQHIPPDSSCRLPVRLELALDHPQEEKAEQLKHAWNPADRSLNIFVKENDPFTFHR